MVCMCTLGAVRGAQVMDISGGTCEEPTLTIRMLNPVTREHYEFLVSDYVMFRYDGVDYNSSDGSLVLDSCEKREQQQDALGKFTEYASLWYPASQDQISFGTSVKVYSDSTVSFVQKWVTGANGTATNRPDCTANEWVGCDWMGVASSFPSVRKKDYANASLGWLEWYGEHLNDAHNPVHRGPRLGRFNAAAEVSEGLLVGPLCVLDDMGNVLTISSLTSHMDYSIAQTDSHVLFGAMGSLTRVPAGYSMEILLSASSDGINQGMDAWGSKVLAVGGKKKWESVQSDFIVNHLGYDTANGAYYYYDPIAGDYGVTLSKLHSYFDSEGIPVRFANLDSWRYYKGPGNTGGEGVPLGGGMKNWTTMLSAFAGKDSGVLNAYEATGWTFMEHNRWFSNITDYSPHYEFVLEHDSYAYPGNAMALPLETRFWTELLRNATDNTHCTNLLQDWLWTTFLGLNYTLQTAGASDLWLQQIDVGALEQANMTVQYSMALPRHALSSSALHAVTHVRASDDYGVGERDDQWRIGRSSILAAALGLAPYKDGFMSTPNQPGGAINGSEPNPVLQAAVAVISRGPVMFVDGVTYSDADLLQKTCREDGKLLRPTYPAVAIDKMFTDEIFHEQNHTFPNQTEIWTASSVIAVGDSELSWLTTLSASVQRPISCSVWDLDTTPNRSAYRSPSYVYMRSYGSVGGKPTNTTAPVVIASDDSLTLVESGHWDFELLSIAPVLSNTSWVLVDEISKFVLVSPIRVSFVTPTATQGLDVRVKGSAGEQSKFLFAQISTDKQTVVNTKTVVCTFAEKSETLTASVPAGTCK